MKTDAEVERPQSGNIDVLADIEAILWRADPRTLRPWVVGGRGVRTLGLPLDQWKSDPDFWQRLIHPDDYPRVLGAFEGCAADAQDRQIEHRVIGPDGEAISYSTRVRAHLGADGAVEELTGFMIARGQRQRYVEELRRSRDQLEIILRNVGDGVTAQLPNGMLAYANDAAAKITGFEDAQAMLAAPLEAFRDRFEMFDESGRPFSFADLPGRRALAGEIEPPDALIRWRIRATSRDHWSVVRARPVLDASGRVQLVINVFHDVTEAKRSEHRQRFLADVGALLAASLDFETTLESICSCATPVIADYCAVSISGKGGALEVAAFHHCDPDRKAEARERLEKRRTDSDPPVAQRVLRSAASELVPIAGGGEQLSVPLVARGRTLGTVTFGREGLRRFDPFDRETAEALARVAAVSIDNARLYREAQLAIRDRDDVLAVVSHDLASPLTAVLLTATALMKRAPPGTVGEGLEQIRELAERMEQLVQDLLRASSIQAGRITIVRQPNDVGDLITSTLAVMRALAQQKSIELAEEVEPGLRIDCDRERVLQVLANLVSNAVRYTASGGHVRVCAQRDGDDVRIGVIDDGPGIPAEEQPRIFERWYQARARAHGGARAGAGLGLYIARGIVEAHGGRLWVQSQVDRGSEFWFTLPAPS